MRYNVDEMWYDVDEMWYDVDEMWYDVDEMQYKKGKAFPHSFPAWSAEDVQQHILFKIFLIILQKFYQKTKAKQ